LYLKNELAQGQFCVGSERVDLKAIRLPMFVVGTETDHVAPWRSVYKVRALTRSPDYTFLLTSGGPHPGIVNGPGHPKRRHRVRTWSNETDTLPAEDWIQSTPVHAGSWWPEWQRWLVARSDPDQVPARTVVAQPRAGTETVLEDAPGRYVHE